jgi:hypothetical protein
MATVSTWNGILTVQLQGMERVWALKKQIQAPLDQVVSIERTDPDEAMRPEGLRLPGAYLPRVIAAGSYLGRKGWGFWSVRDRERAVTIRLRDHHYRKLVIDVADPDAVINEVRRAIGQGA